MPHLLHQAWRANPKIESPHNTNCDYKNESIKGKMCKIDVHLYNPPPEMDVWILIHNIDLCCFLVTEYLPQLFALFGVNFPCLKVRWWKKGQIWRIPYDMRNMSCSKAGGENLYDLLWTEIPTEQLGNVHCLGISSQPRFSQNICRHDIAILLLISQYI